LLRNIWLKFSIFNMMKKVFLPGPFLRHENCGYLVRGDCMYPSTQNKVRRMVTVENKVSDFIYSKESIPSTMPVRQVLEFFSVRDIYFVAVTDDLAVSGLIRRSNVAIGQSAPQEWEDILQGPVSRVMDINPLIIDGQCDIVELFRRIISRPEETMFHDIVVTDCGKYSGLVSARRIMTGILALIERRHSAAPSPQFAIKKPMVATIFEDRSLEWRAPYDPFARINALSRDDVLPVKFQGRLDTFSVDELLQVLVQGIKTGRLDLRGSAKGAALFSVFFNNGKIVHAIGNAEQGKNALWKVLKIKNGDFWFHPGVMPVSPTIREEPMFLLMEACRLQDEAVQE